ncbi:DUF6155 family protein [Paenibacillus zanthoxyli]|uniref:DUF6155 family protein n=1 Tax=Paenibacillus zanthoxyli TaxID=369399 RepID=UPI0004B7230A|nr:DUF6155 family protein [Paenibacillus zanthoxyli]
MAEKLNLSGIKRKLQDFSKEELIELVAEAVRISKDARSYVSIKLEGEAALLEKVVAAKDQIYKEFNPIRGFPKLRPSKVKQIFTEMNRLGKGTSCPFELMVYFCEVAVQYIHDEGDIFENMGDCFTDTYEKVIQILNKEKTPDLYERYKDRLKAIANKPDCHCWGIHDSLAGSYSVLKWIEDDES